MLRIGYARVGGRDTAADVARLKALDCQTVRLEGDVDAISDVPVVLGSILAFLQPGDALIVNRVSDLAGSRIDLLQVLQRLESGGAQLEIIDPPVALPTNLLKALRTVLAEVLALEPEAGAKIGIAGRHKEIVALRDAGLRPLEIARRVGVSRMTVWRHLRTQN